MKNIIVKIVSNASLVITMFMLVTAICNIFGDSSEKIFYVEFLTIVVCVFTVSAIEFGILANAHFKTAKSYYISSFMIWYICIAVTVFSTNWMGISIKNLIAFTILFTGIYVLVTKYNICTIRKDAAEINNILKKYHDKKQPD